jgi:hypothetical protein
VDKAPATVYHELLDEGIYVASVSSMYRILHAHGEVKERRRQAVHPARVKPELVATKPNVCWSWDITKLHAIRLTLRMFTGPFNAVAWWTITSGSALATTSATESGSSASTTTGSAPSARSLPALAAERVVPTTSWPRATSWGTRWLPIAPDAPTTKTLMTSPFSMGSPMGDDVLRPAMTGS